LIVDDEPTVLTLLSRSFTRAGYQVTTASSAFEAMELCGSKPFDAILSDVDMPKMNGHDLARWIAGNHPNICCVLMSGFGVECEECPFVGRCLLLRKPFSATEAVALITRMLSQRPV
jgi:DNA-binding NtrC family response regulator